MSYSILLCVERKTSSIVYIASVFTPLTFQFVECERQRGRRDLGGTIFEKADSNHSGNDTDQKEQ